MVSDHPLAMEAPPPSSSSSSSPGTIEIEELPPPTNTNSKFHGRRAWMPSRRRQIPNNTNTNIIPKPKEEEDQQQLHQNRNNYNDDNSSREMHHDPEDGSCISSMDTVAHEATTIPPNEIDHQPDDEQTSQSLKNAHNTLGSKPKLSNMSLLSSAVAYATLERCLLGLNGGEETETTTAVDQVVVETPIDGHGNVSSSSSTSSPSQPAVSSNNINYSKQCKSGHIIDILELRRLSSRGVPDEPPENRIAHDNTTAPLSPTITTMGLGRKSYRPLVWRVLLGYLPPQTSLWNMVLDRDRKLYDMLVQELFSSTCPAPHEYYVHEKKEEEEILTRERGGINSSGNLEKEGQNDNGKQKGITNDGKEFVIDDDDDGQEDIIAEINDNAAPGTPNEFTADETTSTTATTTTAAVTTPIATPLTPGLLSARMQLEWIRGENGGENAVFGTPSQSSSSSSSSKSNNNLARISPMCAMNTPRTRTYNTTMKKAVTVRTITEDIAADLADIEQTSSLAMLEESSGDVVDGVLSHRLKESLLLPYQGDDDEEEEEEEEGNAIMDTINIVDSSEGKSSGAEQSIPPTKPSSEDEATQGDMKMHRHGSSGDDSADDDAFAILPTTTPNSSSTVPPDNDEEENMILLDEIRKDVIRTHPDLRFFLEPEDGLGQKRYAALERILFVWAKLNKGVRYVQGMNEIVGTLYFVLAHDSNEDWSNHAEADTYFLFNALMVEMRDVFVPDLDEADTGIHGRISNMITLLSLHDPEIRCHLDSVGIDPSFYSVRWLTTLLSREFLLPDTIRLWDSMFASTHKDNFLRYVSVTMVMVIRDQLLSGDFSTCLRLLQAYPPTNLDRLLESSRALWIYESQITLACHKGGISLGHALRSIAPPPAIVMAYGLPGGVAPPIREQVRQVGERGVAVARGAANSASTTVVSAGRSFFGSAMSFWRDGNGSESRSKSSIGDGI